MFDALEHKFKNTDQSDLISRLYEGKMMDYVRCLRCGTEKAREDTFLGKLATCYYYFYYYYYYYYYYYIILKEPLIDLFFWFWMIRLEMI